MSSQQNSQELLQITQTCASNFSHLMHRHQIQKCQIALAKKLALLPASTDEKCLASYRGLIKAQETLEEQVRIYAAQPQDDSSQKKQHQAADVAQLRKKLHESASLLKDAQLKIREKLESQAWAITIDQLSDTFFNDDLEAQARLAAAVALLREKVGGIHCQKVAHPLKLLQQLPGDEDRSEFFTLVVTLRNDPRAWMTYTEVQEVRQTLKRALFPTQQSKLLAVRDSRKHPKLADFSKKQSLRKTSVMTQSCQAEQIAFLFQTQAERDASYIILQAILQAGSAPSVPLPDTGAEAAPTEEEDPLEALLKPQPLKETELQSENSDSLANDGSEAAESDEENERPAAQNQLSVWGRFWNFCFGGPSAKASLPEEDKGDASSQNSEATVESEEEAPKSEEESVKKREQKQFRKAWGSGTISPVKPPPDLDNEFHLNPVAANIKSLPPKFQPLVTKIQAQVDRVVLLPVGFLPRNQQQDNQKILQQLELDIHNLLREEEPFRPAPRHTLEPSQSEFLEPRQSRLLGTKRPNQAAHGQPSSLRQSIGSERSGSIDGERKNQSARPEQVFGDSPVKFPAPQSEKQFQFGFAETDDRSQVSSKMGNPFGGRSRQRTPLKSEAKARSTPQKARAERRTPNKQLVQFGFTSEVVPRERKRWNKQL